MAELRTRHAKRTERQARRAALTGSGPVSDSAPPARFPGAKDWFGLLGEVLTAGLLVTIASLAIVTMPAALVAGVGHTRRFLRGEESTLARAWGDFKSALVGGIAVALAALALVVILLVDLDLSNSGFLPGGPLVGAIGGLGLAVVGLALFTTAGLWSPKTGWRGALRALPAAVRWDPAGAGYTVATGFFAVVVTWQLIPLVVPALGCVVLAIVAIPERTRRRHSDEPTAG